ncbi:MAG: ATP-binding protein [Bacillota bacterium]
MKRLSILFIICLFVFILISSMPVYASDSMDYILINKGWQYRFGDSPTGRDNLPVWIKEDSTEWKSLNSISIPLNRPLDKQFAWFRVKIPYGSWNTPAIYFEELIGQNVTIYINAKEIYQKVKGKNAGDVNQIIIPLYEEAYNQYLYIRVNSTVYPRFGPAGSIYLGDYQEISALYFRKGFLSEMSGFSLIFMGICLFIISFLIKGKQRRAVISLSFGAISVGIILATYLTNFTVRYPQYEDFLHSSFDLFIIIFFISITFFFEQIFGAGYKKIIRRSWQVLIAIMLVLIFVITLKPGGFIVYIATYTVGILTILQFVLLVTAAVYYSFKGSLDAKIFMAGFSTFALVLTAEMMIFLFYSNNYKFFAFRWGIIVFILSQIVILGRKIASYHYQVVTYSKELETKNQELDMMWNEVRDSRDKLALLNKTLESRVAERTRQLEDANEELVALNEELSASNTDLSNALEMLKNTQEQLIKSEKMAALGQLVSAIAHELNTSLGAIQASINNINEYADKVYSILPQFLKALTPEKTHLFFNLISDTKSCDSYISTRDERIYKRALIKELQSLGIRNTEKLAEQLVTMGIYEHEQCKEILEDPEKNLLIEMAYLLSCLKRSTNTISLASEKTTKVVFALKSYSHQGSIEEAVETDITESIETVLTIYHNKIKHGVEVIKNYAKLPKIRCNPDELTQVWTNIIHNALQAMEYKGVLTIDTSVSGDYVAVSFTDSGPGIPEEIKEKIFQPFFTTKQLGEGTGLGLDIVSRIIDKHNGKIEVKSAPGNTTFTVFIPNRTAQ